MSKRGLPLLPVKIALACAVSGALVSCEKKPQAEQAERASTPRPAQTAPATPAPLTVAEPAPSAPPASPALAPASAEAAPPSAAVAPEPALPEAKPPAAPIPVVVMPARLAPAGVFFLLRPISFEQAEGVVGLEPGTAVRKTEEGTYEAQGHRFQLSDDQVTNDISVAERAFAADEASQSRLRAALAAPPPSFTQGGLGQAPLAAVKTQEGALGKSGRSTPAAPAGPQLAPEGVFYLLRATSVEVSDGVHGLKPGTAMRKQPDGSYLADGHKVQIPDSDVTNDMQVARQALGADVAAQERLRQASQAGAAAERAAAMAAPSKTTPNRAPARSSSGKSSSGSNLQMSGGLEGSTLQRGGGLGGKSR